MKAIVLGLTAVIVVGLLIWQEGKRRRVTKAQVIDAPVARRRLIVTAALAGLCLMGGLFSVMAASTDNWGPAFGFVAMSVAGGAALWFTRKPVGVLRLDSSQQTLGYLAQGAATQIDLRQPFRLHSAIKTSMLPSRLRGDPFMVVTVEQGVSSIAFCFPWTLRELSALPSASTAEPLPPVMLDWRGAVILERLRASVGT